MGQPLPPFPALLVLTAFSRHRTALDWAKARAAAEWGPVPLQSTAFAFDETDYYRKSMGADLKKVFWVFERAFDPADLADVKRLTNAWEAEYASLARQGRAMASDGSAIGEPRPLNLDPGYLTAAKLVLASTKDHAHRIYVRDGIFAEVTLFYRHGRWEHHEFTFPDYRRADYHEFFCRAREYLKTTSRLQK
jgi:hypothetical protein